MQLMAERVMTSRQTIARVERGDPTVSVGILATVLFVLGRFRWRLCSGGGSFPLARLLGFERRGGCAATGSSAENDGGLSGAKSRVAGGDAGRLGREALVG